MKGLKKSTASALLILVSAVLVVPQAHAQKVTIEAGTCEIEIIITCEMPPPEPECLCSEGDVV